MNTPLEKASRHNPVLRPTPTGCPFVGHEHDDVIQSLTRQLDVRAVILAGQFGHMLPHATDMPLQGFGTRLIGLGVLVVHESRKRHSWSITASFPSGVMQDGVGNHPLPGLFVQDGLAGAVAQGHLLLVMCLLSALGFRAIRPESTRPNSPAPLFSLRNAEANLSASAPISRVRFITSSMAFSSEAVFLLCVSRLLSMAVRIAYGLFQRVYDSRHLHRVLLRKLTGALPQNLTGGILQLLLHEGPSVP